MNILDLPINIHNDEIAKHLSIRDIFRFFSSCKSLWDKNKVWAIVARNLGLSSNGSDTISWVKRTVRWLENRIPQLSQSKIGPLNEVFKTEVSLVSSSEKVLYLQQKDLYDYFMKSSIPHTSKYLENDQLLITVDDSYFSYIYIRAKNTCDVWLFLARACREEIPHQLEFALNGSAQDLIDCTKGFDIWFTAHLEKLKTFKTCQLPYLNLRFLPPQLGQLTNLEVLDLSNNSLYKLPEEIKNLNLKKLDLTNNAFYDFPNEILQMNSLENLDLGLNPLTNIPSEFQNLSNLKQFQLSSHGIKELPLGFKWPPKLVRPPNIPIKKLSFFKKMTTFF